MSVVRTSDTEDLLPLALRLASRSEVGVCFVVPVIFSDIVHTQVW